MALADTNRVVSRSIFSWGGRPYFGPAVPLSLQHFLAMIMGAVTVPIIVAGAAGISPTETTLLIQMSLIFSALSTLLQLYGASIFGARLPVIFGVGFAYVPALVAIAPQYGIAGIMGAQIAGGIAMMFIGLFMSRIRKFFPPIVAGTVVLVIGLSLYPIAINYMAGGIGAADYGSGANWMIGLFTLAVVLGISKFASGFLRLAAIICGIIAGYALPTLFGKVDLSPVAAAPWVMMPMPLEFGIEFHSAAIIAMVVICAVNSVQTIGDLSATTVGGMERELSSKELFGGLMGNGFSTFVGAFFGGFPTSSFSQNVGIVVMTKVISRRVLAFAAFFILIAGIVPKFGAVMTTIPFPVLGGATIIVFGMITMMGIQLINKDEMSVRNVTIVALALAMAMGLDAVPQALEHAPTLLKQVIGGSPIVTAAATSILLNILLPEKTLADEARERADLEQKLMEK